MRPTLPPRGRRVRNWIGVLVGPFVALAILLLGLDQPKPLFYTLEAAIVFGAWIYMLILLIRTPRTPRKQGAVPVPLPMGAVSSPPEQTHAVENIKFFAGTVQRRAVELPRTACQNGFPEPPTE